MVGKGNEEIVMEAVTSLGDKLYAIPPAEVAQKVTERALLIRQQIDGRSLVMRVLSSTVITGTVRTVTFEGSSSRFVVEFVADNGEGEVETIRSERTDGRNGDVARKLWGSGLVGHRVAIYKNNEPGRDGKASNGYRVAPWVVDLGLAGR